MVSSIVITGLIGSPFTRILLMICEVLGLEYEFNKTPDNNLMVIFVSDVREKVLGELLRVWRVCSKT
jgi:hypothetical protein